MRRHILLILFLLLIPTVAFAWKVEGPGSGGGTGTPGGTSGQYQVNNDGSFGGKSISEMRTDLGMGLNNTSPSNWPYVGTLGELVNGTIGTGLSGAGGTLSVDQATNFNFTGAVTLGDATTNNLQKVILKKATSMADHDWQGMAILGTAGENLSRGDVLYKKLNSSAWKYYKYDANGTDKLILPSAIATADITSGQDGVVLLKGVMRDDTWNLSPSADSQVTVYASTTPGGVSLTAPSTSGDEAVIIGVLVAGNTIETAWGMEWVEVK